jgi:hypothetical protein
LIKKWSIKWIWIKKWIDQISLNLKAKVDPSNEFEFESKGGWINWIWICFK